MKPEELPCASCSLATKRPELTPIPQDIQVKPAFKERYKQLLGQRYDAFMKFSQSYIRKCIRVNTLKSSVADVQKRLAPRWNLTPIPWCKEGFYIDFKEGKRFDIGNLEEHQFGYIYVQDAASMIPPVVLAPQPGERVLDLCSAPGSKTTQLAMYMQNTGCLIANDVDVQRIKPLGMNLQRCGVRNVITTIRSYKRLKELGKEHGLFDRVLVDAPCTGTGTIRRSLKTLLMWSPGAVTKMAKQQRIILKQGFDLLEPGGTLVYSTCTQEPEENEAVVSWLLETCEDARIEPIKLDIKRSPAVTAWQDQTYHQDTKHCLRIYPQDNDTEGFFVAKLRKSS